MRSAKGLILMAAVTAGVIAALVLIEREPAEPDAGEGGPMLPDLADRLNEVRKVRYAAPDGAVTLVREGDRWQVGEKDGYPANQETVIRLLAGLAQLDRIEAKTRDPERYHELGLEDPEVEGAGSTHIELLDGEGTAIAGLLAGDRRPGRMTPSEEEIYVRIPGAAQSWLVEGMIPNHQGAAEWLDEELLAIDRGRVRAVRVQHPGGETLQIRRDDPAAHDFRIVDIPEGAEVESSYLVNNVAFTLAELRLEDVAPWAEPSGPASWSAELETFDGLRVSLDAYGEGEATRVRLSAAYDAALRPAPEPEAAEPDSEAAGKETPELPAAEEVQAEADRLNERWDGWLYAVPSHRLDSIAKRTEDLVTLPEAPGDAGEAAPDSAEPAEAP